MRRFLLGLAIILATGTLSPARAINVVAAEENVAAIAREVVGSSGSVVTLATPHQDPHFVDARPSLLVPLSRADALVFVGLDMEVGWLPVLLKGCRNANLQPGSPGYIEASDFISPLDVPAGKVERSMGDVHPRGNPHYLMDPRNAVKVARGLADRFSVVEPAHADAFKANAERFVTALEKKVVEWETRLAPLRGVGLVAHHKSFTYLVAWLGLRPVGFVEPKPGVPPSPGHVVELIMLARSQKAKLFLTEEWYPTATDDVVAQKAGGKLTVVQGMPSAGQSYAAHLEDLVKALEAAAR
jgi:zinc/manganese transport system substrate-binding protein